MYKIRKEALAAVCFRVALKIAEEELAVLQPKSKRKVTVHVRNRRKGEISKPEANDEPE